MSQSVKFKNDGLHQTVTFTNRRGEKQQYTYLRNRKVLNPLTGRLIDSGGRTYKAMLKTNPHLLGRYELSESGQILMPHHQTPMRRNGFFFGKEKEIETSSKEDIVVRYTEVSGRHAIIPDTIDEFRVNLMGFWKEELSRYGKKYRLPYKQGYAKVMVRYVDDDGHTEGHKSFMLDMDSLSEEEMINRLNAEVSRYYTISGVEMELLGIELQIST